MHPTEHTKLPLLIFDGDCGFCRYWVNRWQRMVGERVVFAPLQDEEKRRQFSELSTERLSESVHLCFPDGEIVSGAEAVFRLFQLAGHRLPLLAYNYLPGFSWFTELSYNLVARNRILVSKCLRCLVGRLDIIPEYQVTTALFHRLLGIVLAIAFVSLLVQFDTLLGSDGISPAADYLERVEAFSQERQIGLDRYRLVPTLFWLNHSDGILYSSVLLGLGFSLLAIAGIWIHQSLIGAFLIYLSFISVGQSFFAFQWDTLLLEVVFLSAFVSQWSLNPRKRFQPINPWAIFALRLLLFKLMLASGWVKLLSDDPLWRNLTALTVHYETQPLPSPLAWHLHQLPIRFHQWTCGGMFLIELLIPFLILAPRRWRLLAAGPNIALQIVIILTGNYGFFNWLTLILCVLLFDDQALKKLSPKSLWGRLKNLSLSKKTPSNPNRIRLGTFLAFAMILLSGIQLWNQLLAPRLPLPNTILRPVTWLAPFHINNRYGLFASMTSTRPELTIQGTNDGTTWKDYHFHYKPGRLDANLPWVAPHQPRVDWQMWFAALGRSEQNPWLVQLCSQLLVGNPKVAHLFRDNPFPQTAPRQVRVIVQRYRFTDRATRLQNGNIWQPGEAQIYLPPMSLKTPQAQ